MSPLSIIPSRNDSKIAASNRAGFPNRIAEPPFRSKKAFNGRIVPGTRTYGSYSLRCRALLCIAKVFACILATAIRMKQGTTRGPSATSSFAEDMLGATLRLFSFISSGEEAFQPCGGLKR